MIHIYYGDGKGKTTAAFGLALRAIGANKKVAVFQFLKKGDSSEIKAIKKYKLPIDVIAFGIGFYKILGDKHSDNEHQKSIDKAWAKAKKIITNKKYDLIILDEINVAIDLGLLDINEVVDTLITNNDVSNTDFILTGRNPNKKLIKIADLVTEMKKHKHYFDKSVKAKKGIEF